MEFDFFDINSSADRYSRSAIRSRHRREVAAARRRRRRVIALSVLVVLLVTLCLGLPRAMQPVIDGASAGEPTVRPVLTKSEAKPRALRVSDRALAFIAEFEGFFPEVYDDPAGHCTIGYGTLIHLGGCTEQDRASWGSLTRTQALSLMRGELAGMERQVHRMVKVPLNQNQYDALLSFAYNCGTSALSRSSLLSLLNRGLYRQAADQLPRWDKADGKSLPGLTRRRAFERTLFLAR